MVGGSAHDDERLIESDARGDPLITMPTITSVAMTAQPSRLDDTGLLPALPTSRGT